MTVEWNEAALQQYIDDQTEETLTLEYKGADALEKTDWKKKEITKDVSAMANSTGGLIIYGISEYKDSAKKHLPEALSPINRRGISKEWLEQVINNIRPHIDDLLIHPVPLISGADDVAYVVEIPQSSTAHQATDKKYYKRFNFLSEPMEDYEIRDILNRQNAPNASVEFGFDKPDRNAHTYLLKIFVTNDGASVIQNFQLEFTFPHDVGYENSIIQKRDNIDLRSEGDYVVTYRSKSVLFPNERREIGCEMVWRYKMDSDKYSKVSILEFKSDQSAVRKDTAFVQWTLYADNMTPKKGATPFRQLHEFH
jgi:hypothetical protein